MNSVDNTYTRRLIRQGLRLHGFLARSQVCFLLDTFLLQFRPVELELISIGLCAFIDDDAYVYVCLRVLRVYLTNLFVRHGEFIYVS